MSAFLVLAALAALAAVARADFVVVSNYALTDTACATLTGTNVVGGGCTPYPNQANTWVSGSCSTSMLNLYTAAGCSGTPASTVPLATYFGGAASTCITYTGNPSGNIKVKYSCFPGTATAANFPDLGLVTLTYTDQTCTTPGSAYQPIGCQANQPTTGTSSKITCTATQVTTSTYSGSTTCSTAASTTSRAVKTTCSYDSGAQAYTSEICNALCVAGSTFNAATGSTPCANCATAGPGQRITTACTAQANAVVVACATGTFSALGSQTATCAACSDPNAAPNAAATACVCKTGFSPTAPGADPMCVLPAMAGYVVQSDFASATCSGPIKTVYAFDAFASGCKAAGSNTYMLTSCLDSSRMQTSYYSDSACSGAVQAPSINTYTCQQTGPAESNTQTCMKGAAFPTTAPAVNGTYALMTHYAAGGNCAGKVDTLPFLLRGARATPWAAPPTS